VEGEDLRKAMLEGASYRVESVEAKPIKRNPFAALHHLDPAAGRQSSQARLRAASRTMQVAQKLYEGIDIGGETVAGLITYMRTDGVQMAPEAIDAGPQG
jgi:DNA topoisomerase-1